MATSHLARVKVFEAQVSRTTLGNGDTAFRIAAPSRKLVDDELARLLEMATSNRATFMYLTAFWGSDWVCHGEIRPAKGEQG